MVCLPLAIAALAEQQIEHERMIQTAVSRLDKAAAVVGELGKREGKYAAVLAFLEDWRGKVAE